MTNVLQSFLTFPELVLVGMSSIMSSIFEYSTALHFFVWEELWWARKHSLIVLWWCVTTTYRFLLAHYQQHAWELVWNLWTSNSTAEFESYTCWIWIIHLLNLNHITAEIQLLNFIQMTAEFYSDNCWISYELQIF